MIRALYSDDSGNVFHGIDLVMLGRSWDETWEVVTEDVSPLPSGATLAVLPGRQAIGLDLGSGDASAIWLEPETQPGRGAETPAWAVGALLPAGFTRTLLPAYVTHEGHCKGPTLPLYGYAAVGMGENGPCVACVKTDDPARWDPRSYNTRDLEFLIEERLRRSPNNRILRQLAKCSKEYSCFTAQNVFYRRWEAGIPVSPECHASCVGCISLQPAECCPSPQSRIDFVPTEDEIVEIAVPHLREAPHAIVSFGQGCEGEPLLQADLIARAIARARSKAPGRGLVNVNTSGGLTDAVTRLCKAGLDSMRVSIVSARHEVYNAYHRPRGYDVSDVESSIVAAKDAGVYVSLNLLVFPGLTDREEELDALCALVARSGLDMVQLRNMNIDPDVLTSVLPGPRGRVLGISAFVEELQERCPGLRIGSFTPSREEITLAMGCRGKAGGHGRADEA